MRIIRHILHPILKQLIKGKEIPDIIYLNEAPRTNKNAIYVANHQCVYDGPMAALSIPDHFYVLIGKQRLEVEDRLFFVLNGSIWLDRKSKKESYQSKRMYKAGSITWGKHINVS